MRRDLTFPSGGDTCAAWFYEPEGGPPQPWPCVVLAHGFGGVREARLDAFAERFAAAGLAALVFDYRHFGASTGQPRQLLDIRRQHDDWRAALAFARALPEVDGDRVAAWGTSFSGGHVTVMAAEDSRLAAAVSQAPFMDGIATLKVQGPANVGRLTVAGLRDQVGSWFGRPSKVPLVGPPGSVAAMTSPDAEPGYRAMFAPGQPFRNEAYARVLLRVGQYRPVTRAKRITCPWLVVVADRDAVTPPEPALKAAAMAARAEVRRHDCGHFDVYVGEVFERNVADQVEFLTRVLGAGGPGYAGNVAATR